jgi:phosphoribosyl-ATP pyrophosphohydrolase
MATYYQSIATAKCEFTFSDIPSYTASFTASATDPEESVAIKLSESAVLEVIQQYIANQQSELINEIVDITYDVTYVNDNVTTFSLYLNKYTGSFNYATEPYSDIPETDLNSIVVYNDNGQSQVFKDENLLQTAGFLLYCDVSTDITLPGQPRNLALNINDSYFLENGTIITTGVCNNVTDEEGYFFPGTVVNFRIIGGSGIYADAVGSVTMEIGENNFAKLTFSIAK